MKLQFPNRLDRPTFWLWAICLVIGKIVVALIMVAGVRIGGAELAIVIAFASVVGARFRDIGWPVWIGPTFVLVTMAGLPFAVFGYSIALHLPLSESAKLFNAIGLFSGFANLLLLVVAGSVPGTQLAPPSPDLSEAASEAASQPSATPARSGVDDLAIFGGLGLVVLLVLGGLVVHSVSLAPANTTASSSPALSVQSNGLTKETNDYLRQLAPAGSTAPNPPARYQSVQSNGLTKETNDFLRQLSRQPPARQ